MKVTFIIIVTTIYYSKKNVKGLLKNKAKNIFFCYNFYRSYTRDT